MRQVQSLLTILVLVASAPAFAADKKPRLMLLDLPPDKAFEPNALKIVNSFLAKDLRDQGFEVITPTDIASALGVERQKQLMGCTESSCLAEIGGAMGADFIVHGELAALERDTALTLTVTNTRGQALNEVADVVKGKESESLLEAVNRDVPKLVQPLRDSGKLSTTSVSSAPKPSTIAAISTSPPPPTNGAGSHTASFVALGIGAACLIGSGFTGALAEVNNTQLANDTSNSGYFQHESDATPFRNTITAEAWTSTGLLVVGVVAAGVGIVWMLNGSDAPAHAAIGKGGTPGLAWEF